MPYPDARFSEAIRLFDAANDEDPNRVPDDEGRPVAKEVLYVRRMSAPGRLRAGAHCTGAGPGAKARLGPRPRSATARRRGVPGFLEHYLLPFAAQHPEVKVTEILQKTWTKMSAQGHQLALQLPLTAEAQRLVKQALAE